MKKARKKQGEEETERRKEQETRTPHSDLRDQEGVNNLVELRSGSGF